MGSANPALKPTRKTSISNSPTFKFQLLQGKSLSLSLSIWVNGGSRTMDAPQLNDCGGRDYAAVRGWGELKAVAWAETVKMWTVAGPVAFATVCMYGVSTVTSAFAGHIGDLELSAVTISLDVISGFAFGFTLGMGSALETLCGQAFGAGHVHMLGIYLQRSCVIVVVSCIPLLPIYIYATPILKLLGQKDDIAELAGKFAFQIIPEMFALAVTFPAQKFLQAQSKVAVLAWIGVGGLLTQVVLLSLFVPVFGWGLSGTAAAYDISYWVIAVAHYVYIMGWCKDGWKGLSWAAFKDIWAFVRLSLASAVMICLEVWYMTSIVLVTGYLDNAVTAVGSLSICNNISGLESMLFFGINAAISVRVSNELGFGHPRAAKYSVFVTVTQSLLLGLFFMTAILITRDYFAVPFTSSKELQQSVSRLAYLLGLTMLLNSVQPVISGVAVGAGWQALVAYINLGCYYIFGLPLGILLGFIAKWGVMGIWGGMIIGTALQTLLLLLVLYKTNWHTEVEKTTERMLKWGGQDINKSETNADNSI